MLQSVGSAAGLIGRCCVPRQEFLSMVEVQASQVATIKDLARQLRVDSIRCTTEAGSGHPTSSMSAADIMAVLMT